MSKFNVTGRFAAAASSPIHTQAIATGVTYEGASGYARDAKSELFLLAVSNMVGENTRSTRPPASVTPDSRHWFAPWP